MDIAKTSNMTPVTLAETIRRLPSSLIKEHIESLGPEIGTIQRELAVREGRLARLQSAYEEAVIRERELSSELEQLRQREADLAAIYHNVAADVEAGLSEEQSRFEKALESEARHHRDTIEVQTRKYHAEIEAEDRRHRAAVEAEERRRQEVVEALQRRRGEALKALEDIREQLSAIGPNPCPLELPAPPAPAIRTTPADALNPINIPAAPRTSPSPLSRLLNVRAMRLRGLADSLSGRANARSDAASVGADQSR